jgi:hypothetical protein
LDGDFLAWILKGQADARFKKTRLNMRLVVSRTGLCDIKRIIVVFEFKVKVRLAALVAE